MSAARPATRFVATLAAGALAASVGAFATACARKADAPAPAFGTGVDAEAAAREVKAELLHAWQGYENHAWGFDELVPLEKKGRNWHEQSILMTPVDSLDTLILLGLEPEADRALALIKAQLGFDRDFEVQVFEITIRSLGGLLSAYQLTGEQRLLELADDLGGRLLPAFDSPTGMPYRFVHLRTGATRDKLSNPAEIGTLILEFGTLAKLTGKDEYFEKAKRALVAVYERRSPIGLVGQQIDVESGEWTDTTSHVGGAIDSYYEYLLKCARLFDDPECRAMYDESIAAVNDRLADEVGGGLWYGESDMTTGARTATVYGALHAFLPGVLALGGDLDRAGRLQDSGFEMWRIHGVEPELWDYAKREVVAPGYPLRPEIIESAYVLHELTGDPRYLEMGRVFLGDLVRYCRTPAGYTSLRSVVTHEQGDRMHSFFLAETLKYLYLLFDSSPLDFQRVVFNTEAHPLRRTW